MIVSTTWNLELLFESSSWNIDDTFKVEPSICYPLVTINVVADFGRSIPVVVALLPDKASTTYNRMFNAIMGFPFVLSTMSSVFEKTCKLDYLPWWSLQLITLNRRGWQQDNLPYWNLGSVAYCCLSSVQGILTYLTIISLEWYNKIT